MALPPHKTPVARTFLILLAGLALAACTTTPPRRGVEITRVEVPQWARTGKHPKYPESTYLVAFGTARTKGAAEAIATARLEETLVNWAMTQDNGALRGTQFSRLVLDRANWFALFEFGESVQSDYAGNGFEHIALRALHKGDYRLLSQSMIGPARESMLKTPASVAGDFRTRIDIASRAFLAAARVLALRFVADGELDRPALENAEDAALSIWELPGLVKLQQTGAGQKVQMKGSTQAPLSMRATFRNSTLAKVPLRWSVALGARGVLDGATETSETGEALCSVLQMSPTGDEYGFVQCQVDLDRMTPRRTGITMPAWQWQLIMPCRRNVEVILVVKETIDEQSEGHENYFKPALKTWAMGRSLTMVEDSPSLRDYAYRIRIEGQIIVTTWKDGETAMARTSGKITLFDHADGRELFEWIPGILRRGEDGVTTDSLGLATLREAASEGLAEFCTRLLATVPAPGEEFGRGR